MDKPIYALEGKRIFIAGHTGMVGSALMRRFAQENCEIITASHSTLDLTRQSPTESYIADVKPDVIIVAAARVGGILANAQYPADFLYDNLAIGMNVIHAAHLCNVERLLWLGSSCIYPRDAVQPLQESALLTGPLEPTNEAYAIAKIAAASVDDISANAAKAGSKTIGVLIDDAAVTPNYVVGIAAARELPMIGKIAIGSLRNKALLIPALLALDYFLPIAITALLMIGGAYLCFEGAEKVWHKLFPSNDHHEDGGSKEKDPTAL